MGGRPGIFPDTPCKKTWNTPHNRQCGACAVVDQTSRLAYSSNAPAKGSSSHRRWRKNVEPYGMYFPPSELHCTVCFHSSSPCIHAICSSGVNFFHNCCAFCFPTLLGYACQKSIKESTRAHPFPTHICSAASPVAQALLLQHELTTGT